MAQFSLLKQIAGLAGWLAVTFLAAAAGSAASAEAPAFYSELVLPQWAPPSWVFGPVWTILYLLMAVSAWLVWRVRGFGAARLALTLFLVQLVFNALWSWLFFIWNLGGWSFACLLLLLVLILATMTAFRRVHAPAGWLLTPYLFWATFAAVLNYEIWRLNPAILG